MSKLTRTQVYLDPDYLDKVKPRLDSEHKSLAQYLRELMKKDIDGRPSEKQTHFNSILKKAGSVIISSTGVERITHNKVYMKGL